MSHKEAEKVRYCSFCLCTYLALHIDTLLLTIYSNKLDLVFYISHKLMDYLHHFKS